MQRRVTCQGAKITEEGALALQLANNIVNISKKLRKAATTKDTSRFYRYYRCRKTSVADLVPGDKVLLLRQHGGVGDILVMTQLLNEFARRYPKCDLTFACREGFHSLFKDVKGINIFPYEMVHFDGWVEDGSDLFHTAVTDCYDMVMDLTIPCHVWEEIMFDPQLCQFRNRLDMWGNWIGMYDFPRNVKSCVRIGVDDIQHVMERYIKPVDNSPIAIVAPTSANVHKDYLFYSELIAALAKHGYHVVAVGERQKMRKAKNVIHTSTYREFLSLFYAANLVVSVDSAAFHAGGIAEAKTFGIFNTNDGVTYSRYYPTAVPIQVCDKRCIWKYCTPGNCIGRRQHEIVMSTLREHGVL